MLKLRFRQGGSSPCIYWSELRKLKCSVHDDDFTVTCDYSELLKFRDELSKFWTVENRGILARPGSNLPGTVQSITVLNRLIAWAEHGVECHPDPRHVDLVLQEAGQFGRRGFLATKMLQDNYRSISMRIGYVSLDRPDLQRATQELAKGLQRPTVHHWTLLKRVAR